MKNKILLFSVMSLFFYSCGKNGGESTVKKANGGIGQFIELQTIKDSPLTNSEKALGKAFCDNLQYKNANFFELYGTSKKFKFSVDLQDCSKVATGGKSTYQYKKTNGLLSYNQILDDGPVITPAVEIDSNGAFSDYCSVRNNVDVVRYFGAADSFKYFIFFEGNDCGGPDVVCGRVSMVQSNTVTYSKKLVIVNNSSANNQFGLSLRGQEYKSETYQNCGNEEPASQLFSLDSISNI